MDKSDELWSVVEKGISKLKAIFAGEPESPFTAEEHMLLYSTIYELCNCKPSQQLEAQRLHLYNNHRIIFEDYLSSTVLFSLQEKHGESLLRDFSTRWSNHKLMASTVSRWFLYLDRFFIPKMCYPDLKEVAYLCFQEQIYANMKGEIRDTVLFLIDQEREGHEVDQALLKNAVSVFVEIGKGQMHVYEEDFEAPMLQRTSTYYSQKAPILILQADECLKAEKDRVSHYLHPSSEEKLLERVRHEFLTAHNAQSQLQLKLQEMQLEP